MSKIRFLGMTLLDRIISQSQVDLLPLVGTWRWIQINFSDLHNNTNFITAYSLVTRAVWAITCIVIVFFPHTTNASCCFGYAILQGGLSKLRRSIPRATCKFPRWYSGEISTSRMYVSMVIFYMSGLNQCPVLLVSLTSWRAHWFGLAAWLISWIYKSMLISIRRRGKDMIQMMSLRLWKCNGMLSSCYIAKLLTVRAGSWVDMVWCLVERDVSVECWESLYTAILMSFSIAPPPLKVRHTSPSPFCPHLVHFIKPTLQ